MGAYGISVLGFWYFGNVPVAVQYQPDLCELQDGSSYFIDF